MNTSTNQRLITDFSHEDSEGWQPVNDGVMGGLSRSQFQINEQSNALFTGHISLQNNGGFAAVKKAKSLNIENADFIRLRIKGDGKRYSFRLRTNSSGTPNHWVYERRLDTPKDQWITIDLALSNLKAVFRGRPQPEAPPADLAAIIEYGFLISDRQAGDFCLEIDAIYAMANN